MMRDYTLEICTRFLRKYPKSAAFSGGRKLRLAGWYAWFPEIRNSYEDKTAFLESVDELCDRGILTAKWKRYREGEELEALYLSDAGALFQFTGRMSPHDVEEQVKQCLHAFLPKTELCRKLHGKLLALHEDEESAESRASVLYVKWAQLLDMMEQFPKLISDMLLLADVPDSYLQTAAVRQASTELFHDSKRIERMLPAADRISMELLGKRLSEMLHLERVYPETACCLPGSFHFIDGRIWELNGTNITLPIMTLSDIEQWAVPENCSNPAVICLENKESYFAAVRQIQQRRNSPAEDAEHIETAVRNVPKSEQHMQSSRRNFQFSGCLYLGGFPNTADAGLIELLARAGADLYCFCDLDPSGIRIAERVDSIVRRCSEKPVRFWKMHAEVFSEYKKYGYTLTKTELRKARHGGDDRLDELREAILATGMGVEQEIIPV